MRSHSAGQVAPLAEHPFFKKNNLAVPEKMIGFVEDEHVRLIFYSPNLQGIDQAI